MNSESLLERKVSFQKDTWSPISGETSILRVLQGIKSDKLKLKVEYLRELFKNNSDLYKIEKLTLPAVTFCATFNEFRQKEHLKIYNQLIVLDIDKLNDDSVHEVRRALGNDDYVFTFWNSPSDYGVKGLVFLEFSFDITLQNRDVAHKSAFIMLSMYYKEKYGIVLDSSGSDTTRLCYLSYDAALVLKENFRPFLIQDSDLLVFKESNDSKKAKTSTLNINGFLYNNFGKNKNYHRQAIRYLIKYL